jgi:hypothetical protein
MPRWLPRLLRRIHELAGRGRVRLTLKAARELAGLGAGLEVQDACDVLAALSAADFAERFESEHTGEWMYVFKPSVAGTLVYLKLILRADCVVVSFHDDEGEADEERS